jgi:thioredoxin reductase
MTETVENYKDCIGTILSLADKNAALAATGYFAERAGVSFTHYFKQLTVMHRHEEASALAEWWMNHPRNLINA